MVYSAYTSKSHNVWSPPMCERDLIYIPGTRYTFRSSRALRQLNRGVHSKTKPTADWLQSHYIHCSKSWVREVLDKSRGIEWHLTVVYLFIYFFDVLFYTTIITKEKVNHKGLFLFTIYITALSSYSPNSSGICNWISSDISS